MGIKTVFNYLIGATSFLLLIVIMVWLVWVPSAKEPDYVFIAAWGENGSAPGQFSDPTGIAVTNDEVFVSDARNARIQVFDFDGNFKREFGSRGDAPGQLGRPMNLSIVGNEIYVADYWNDRIQVFTLNGTPLRTIGQAGSEPGQFNAPGGVAVAPNGDLFVADFYNQRIQHLQPDGKFIEQWGTTEKVGIWAGEFNYPTDVAIATDGTLYAADGYNDRVQVFSSSGQFLRKWGGPFALNIKGSFNGWFTTVSSIAIGPQGNVYATDFYNNRIQKFVSNGKFLFTFGEKGNGPGQFDRPLGVTVASWLIMEITASRNGDLKKSRHVNTC